MKNFNKTLKNYFAGQGLTQSDVAERLQISRTVATNYLNGNKTFGRKAAMKWANTFGIDEVWLLTFALIGINLVDLANLQTISQGRINYTRRKTGRLYSIKVEDCAKRLIQAHRGKNYLVDILEHYKDVHVATSMLNRHLKDIASDLGLPPITTYTARYTWATLALSIDTPIEVISQALGHSYGQAVTLGYIMPDRRKVDEANQKVLALL